MAEPDGLSRKGAAFIARFEGFRSHPYRDAVGVWTIGYGHTAGVNGNFGPITERGALVLLRKDAQKVVEPVRAAAKFKLTQNELDALVSFGFNLGTGYFSRGHTIGNAMHNGKRRATAGAMLLYDQAGGQKLEGLAIRRRAEKRLFLTGEYK